VEEEEEVQNEVEGVHDDGEEEVQNEAEEVHEDGDEGAALHEAEEGVHGDGGEDEGAEGVHSHHWHERPPSWPPTSSSCAIRTFQHRGCTAAPQTQCPYVSRRWHRSMSCRGRSCPYLARGISTLNVKKTER